MGSNYNNYNNDPNRQRPRKRVSKKTLRRRQLGALCVIAFLVLLLIILMAKACSKDSSDKGGDTKPTDVTTTTTATTTAQFATEATTTTTTTTKTAGANDSGFKLDKYSVFLEVGGQGICYVQQYPEGSSEPDEVWTSSDPKIATVDMYGHITGVSGGECYVTLSSKKDSSKEVTIKVTVAGPVNTANNNNTANSDDPAKKDDKNETPEPQQLAEAPAPSKINGDGYHYEGDVLIVNKTYTIPASYYPGGLDPTCYTWFTKLQQGAAKDGLNIYCSSGFRSYAEQEAIYNSNVAKDGKEKTDTYSARPGNSEHQTGLAIDVNIISDAFIGTPEAKWIEDHCWEYGFILRYPKGKQDVTGYKYEPWHIRYVGSDMSKKIHDRGGITLEEYFGLTSKYPD